MAAATCATGPDARLTVVVMRDASLATPGGRALFEGLSLSLTRERVALVGRNGVGKSTLLAALAGEYDLARGAVTTKGRVHFVPQGARASAESLGGSHGERKRLRLLEAERARADVLLLDEPTDDLDEEGVAWLRAWLADFRGCLVVASHDRRLLQDFRHFFIARESGCRYFAGSFAELEAAEEREHTAGETRYLQNLRRQADREEHTALVARRKARKKRYGRCRELDRATSRVRLNCKRSQAQESHGRAAGVREARIAAVRELTRVARRALDVQLPLAAPELAPTTRAETAGPALSLRGVSAFAGGRALFEELDLDVSRERVAIVGPNGSGKTTLLEVLLDKRAPARGIVRGDLSRVGAIAQAAEDWCVDETLLSRLVAEAPTASLAAVATRLVGHRFPLALAERPMRSLSPGERVRAALVCLFERRPAVDVLVLDEPTYALDRLGFRSLVEVLRAWPGGLVVASHDAELLRQVGFERRIELGGRGPQRSADAPATLHSRSSRGSCGS
jgi:ATPase subunit of ABC transporter with duplicated ATPase domains